MIMGQTIGGGFWYNDLQDGSDDSELNGINKGLNMYGKLICQKNILNTLDLNLVLLYENG